MMLRACRRLLIEQKRATPALSRFESSVPGNGIRVLKKTEQEVESKLRRSVLYLPASNERALAKLASIPTDGVILDLEDAVAVEKKDVARANAIQYCSAIDEGKIEKKHELIIRVNGMLTEWHEEDVRAVCRSAADALLVPKVETAEDVLQLEERMTETGARHDLAIWCMIETPLGVLNVEKIAAASKRVGCLVVGTVDLANELECLPSAPGRWNIMFALQKCVLAARASKITALDGVYIDVKNDQGFMDECRQGRELGFDGKTLIHPKTVNLCNQVYSPSPVEIERAHKIVQAHTDAVASGSGVTTLDGKLVEALHVRHALRVLKLASDLRDRS